ncbi:hypothetical protein BJ165DRAFT_1615670 [Panaeolus papilionaceus]|nr:hypothetical protein BJ165DRAFT_1615670 [Panaeolus papilionaceus]
MNLNPVDPGPPTEHENLRVYGTVGVERVEQIESLKGIMGVSNTFLLLGPTGAGKSTFIEALDSHRSLKISSNQLEGFTKSISTYRLLNVKRSRTPIYLVDVPGFADTKVSVMSIVSMLKEWVTRTELGDFSRILYLTPIHIPRLPGSHRRVLQTFHALTGIKTARSITVVSTMWDNIWGDSATRRAESNFSQLRDAIWKEHVDSGSRVVKFDNTKESSLSILDGTFETTAIPRYSFDPTHPNFEQSVFAESISEDLHTRIQDLKVQLACLRSGLQDAGERSDAELNDVLIPQLQETQKLLSKFEQELHEFESTIDSTATNVNAPDPAMGVVNVSTSPSVPIEVIPPASPDLLIPVKRGMLTRIMDSLKVGLKNLHIRRNI